MASYTFKCLFNLTPNVYLFTVGFFLPSVGRIKCLQANDRFGETVTHKQANDIDR